MEIVVAKIYLILLFPLILIACSSKPEVLKRVDYIADGSSAVFAQLRQHHEVVYDSTAMGVFVKAIDGVAQTKTAFWVYFVNGESKPTPAGEFIPNQGDSVEWRLLSGY